MDFEAEENRILNDLEADFLTEEEIENGHQIMPLVDEVIFLVHITEELIANNVEGESPYKVIINSFSSFIKSKIIARSTDKVGLIFFCTVNEGNPRKAVTTT